MDSLRRVVRALSSSSRGQGRGGLTGAQRFVLRQLNDAPAMSLSTLAARTLSKQSTVSEVVSRLVARGLVQRRASELDARQSELSLTAAGKRAIRGAPPTAQERLAAAFGALSAARRRTLATGLEAWIAAAGFAELAPTMFLEEPSGAAGRPDGGDAA